MNSSIFNDVKEIIGGLDASITPFDIDILLFINGVFSILHQLGVGPCEGFSISDSTTTWADYLQNDKRLNMIKTYMSLKTRLYFDPPQSSYHVNLIKEQIAELESRISYAVDPVKW